MQVEFIIHSIQIHSRTNTNQGSWHLDKKDDEIHPINVCHNILLNKDDLVRQVTDENPYWCVTNALF